MNVTHYPEYFRCVTEAVTHSTTTTKQVYLVDVF